MYASHSIVSFATAEMLDVGVMATPFFLTALSVTVGAALVTGLKAVIMMAIRDQRRLDFVDMPSILFSVRIVQLRPTRHNLFRKSRTIRGHRERIGQRPKCIHRFGHVRDIYDSIRSCRSQIAS